MQNGTVETWTDNRWVSRVTQSVQNDTCQLILSGHSASFAYPQYEVKPLKTLSSWYSWSPGRHCFINVIWASLLTSAAYCIIANSLSDLTARASLSALQHHGYNVMYGILLWLILTVIVSRYLIRSCQHFCSVARLFHPTHRSAHDFLWASSTLLQCHLCICYMLISITWSIWYYNMCHTHYPRDI